MDDPRAPFDSGLDPSQIRVRVSRLDALTRADWDAIAIPFNRYGAVVLTAAHAAPRRAELLELATHLGPDPSGTRTVLEIDGVREVFDYGEGDATTFPPHPLHTDGLAGRPPVMAMALQCEVAEASGGFSVIASAARVYREVAAAAPAALASLFEPDAFSVRHGATAQPSPVFEMVGQRLWMRLKPAHYAEVNVSPAASEGFARLQIALDDPNGHVVIPLQPGEILLADNTAVLHGRTPMPRSGTRRLNRLLFDGHGPVCDRLVFGFSSN